MITGAGDFNHTNLKLVMPKYQKRKFLDERERRAGPSVHNISGALNSLKTPATHLVKATVGDNLETDF